MSNIVYLTQSVCHTVTGQEIVSQGYGRLAPVLLSPHIITNNLIQLHEGNIYHYIIYHHWQPSPIKSGMHYGYQPRYSKYWYSENINDSVLLKRHRDQNEEDAVTSDAAYDSDKQEQGNVIAAVEVHLNPIRRSVEASKGKGVGISFHTLQCTFGSLEYFSAILLLQCSMQFCEHLWHGNALCLYPFLFCI